MSDIKFNLDKLLKIFPLDTTSQTMKWLVKNHIIRFTNFLSKFHTPIPFDFRIDQACLGSDMNSVGEKLADRVIEIEKILNTKFDSILCSLYSGIFSGIPTVLFLQQKYGRDFKMAVSRRDYTMTSGVNSKIEEEKSRFFSSIHTLKNKTLVGELGNNVLIHDEMSNSGNTIKHLIDLCHYNNVQPRAAMIIADRILDPLPEGVHMRILDNIPCYSLITHFEIVEWCEKNKKIWHAFYQDNNNQYQNIKK